MVKEWEKFTQEKARIRTQDRPADEEAVKPDLRVDRYGLLAEFSDNPRMRAKYAELAEQAGRGSAASA